jgi:hypothetical protein
MLADASIRLSQPIQECDHARTDDQSSLRPVDLVDVHGLYLSTQIRRRFAA